MEERTVRHAVPHAPLRGVQVEVVDGPDAGAVVSAAGDSVSLGSAKDNDLVLTDPTVSRYHVELRNGPTGLRVRDLESTNGTFVSGVQVHDATVTAGTTLTLGSTRIRIETSKPREQPLFEGDELAGIRGRSVAMRTLMMRVQRLAESDAAVLLRGESGTGKELVAQSLHSLGPRAAGPFVTVDCGSIAPALVASELFGHERGAFTGADRRREGAFERAHGGTLFLDELGELPASLQPTLLGVLERRRFTRVGGSQELTVDVRLVAATHRDLRADINEGRFRLDLYYRLAVVKLGIPPLRERVDDIPLLVEHLLAACGAQDDAARLFPPIAIDAMQRHRWPGNVRELRNFVEATLAMGERPELELLELPEGAADPIGALLELPWKEARGALLAQLERRYLDRLMERSGGNVSKGARIAKMDRSHLTDLLRRHGLR